MRKVYPQDHQPRTFEVDDAWLHAVFLHNQIHRIGRDQPLFTTTAGSPISRNIFRTRVWLPAVKASGVDFPVRMHARATPTPPGCSPKATTLKSVMERMGHAQIQTTQKNLHALPEADRKNLDALARAHRRRQRPQ